MGQIVSARRERASGCWRYRTLSEVALVVEPVGLEVTWKSAYGVAMNPSVCSADESVGTLPQREAAWWYWLRDGRRFHRLRRNGSRFGGLTLSQGCPLGSLRGVRQITGVSRDQIDSYGGSAAAYVCWSDSRLIEREHAIVVQQHLGHVHSRLARTSAGDESNHGERDQLGPMSCELEPVGRLTF
jgi:hypothetical protein